MVQLATVQPFAPPKESSAETRFQETLPLAMMLAWTFRNIPGATLDELRSEARLATWEAAQAFDPSRNRTFEAFAKRAIKNRLISLYRKETTFRTAIQTTLDEPCAEDATETTVSRTSSEDEPKSLDLVCLRETKAVLAELILELPERHRDVLWAYLHGETSSETARKIGITKQSISAIKSRALEVLRQKLGERHFFHTEQLMARRPFDPSVDTHESPQSTVEQLLKHAAALEISNFRVEQLVDGLLPELDIDIDLYP